MSGRARARSRGRARGQETAAPGAQPPPPQQAARPMRPPPSEGELVGRGRQKTAPAAAVAEGFQQVKLSERGGRRRDFHDSGINTRQLMEHVKESKTGLSGSRIELRANYMRLLSRPQWALFQYHVDFNPPMESRRLRTALLYTHEDETVLWSESRFQEKVQITVTLTNELPPSSPVCLQFYSIIFRRILKILNMQQIGRHYYNPMDPLNIPQHRLTIWPGFVTNILQYESSIMLCLDVSHKVLRSETVLDFMGSLRQQYGDQRFMDVCTKELVGVIVLTKYNNKTYRVDDIAWDHTPNNTFKKGDTDISFKEYYMKAALTPWGLNFENRLLSLTGRVLPAERILQGQRVYEYKPREADWSKEMRGLPLISSVPLENWLMFYTRRNADIAHSLLQTLNKVSGPMGIRMQRAGMIEYDDRQESLLRALQQNVGQQIQMVVVILPTNRKDKYDCVKKYLCVDCPTPSQCVVARTLSRPQALMTIATKIALQMNCKMGGELWSVDIPLKHLMIVGIDCYHDTTSGRRSIGALVASLNQGMTRWFSKCVLQSRGQEIIDGLKVALQAALKTYFNYNKSLPSRIIVYRDGVGDGMLQSVVSYEVPQIMQSIKAMGEDYTPKLSVVVVKKRIASRFFALLDGRLGNPPPGTVIDTEVTRPEWYDFFIVSQAVRLGSVSPTHYNVVYDSSGLKPDHMQRLTYKLCHLYYNWQGIVRVPAPCQYAHKLAFLVGQSIHREPNLNLDDLLYYL
ncbi:Piwi-like protein 1 [Bagarius yarrelli]|uniref:Piwi-like protein 1 n=1 Tax=Bagarius yarrelli TaxID=175774 RepID=A0A556UFR0_BAGYA|nr:Piwi-like protein 1 [Bagarius yarrelli]